MNLQPAVMSYLPWAHNSRSETSFFHRTNPLLKTLPAISSWVTSQKQYRPAAVNLFFQGADLYLYCLPTPSRTTAP